MTGDFATIKRHERRMVIQIKQLFVKNLKVYRD